MREPASVPIQHVLSEGSDSSVHVIDVTKCWCEAKDVDTRLGEYLERTICWCQPDVIFANGTIGILHREIEDIITAENL